MENCTASAAQQITTGTMVQVFLLARSVPAESWCGNGSSIPC
jgi:hypothetical protein